MLEADLYQSDVQKGESRDFDPQTIQICKVTIDNVTCQHGVEKDTQGPYVARFSFVQTTGEHLRSNTLWGPTRSLADRVRILVFAESAELISQYYFRLIHMSSHMDQSLALAWVLRSSEFRSRG